MVSRIPFWVKVPYTAFVAVLVFVYWRDYGPLNFLYFCDVALLMAIPGIWLERPLLVSAAAVGILVIQAFWITDFLVELFGGTLTGMTSYMFESERALFTRLLSLFHLWLPFFLLYAIARLGYDRRAFWAWTALSTVILFVCYLFLPATEDPNDPDAAANVNYVYGMDRKEPQTWMPKEAWFAALLAGLPLIAYLPPHLLLCWAFRPPPCQVAGRGLAAGAREPE